ncbi:MAG TPA: response regulator transcription factor [Ginsengibacter sp.]
MKTVALIDDHVLLRNGLANLIETLGDYKVLFQADNGKQFVETVQNGTVPNIVLVDINMPVMDGYETAIWIRENKLKISILALSMYDDENSIIKMFKAGARGYILKDCDPSELKAALESLLTKGFYYNEMITGKLIHTINTLDEKEIQAKMLAKLNNKEIAFLKLACSEYTYREIAEKMFLSSRTVDGYRDSLFEKLEVKTRVGLVMFAIKNGIITL